MAATGQRCAGGAAHLDDDPVAPLADVARLVDRQLELLRAVLEPGRRGDDGDPLLQHMRRSATEVADRCIALTSRHGAHHPIAATGRRLQAVSALTLWAVPAPWSTADDEGGSRADVVMVLGAAVGDQLRSLVRAMAEATSCRVRDLELPVELFVRALHDRDHSTTDLLLGTVWVAMAAKLTEAARCWDAVLETTVTGPRGAA